MWFIRQSNESWQSRAPLKVISGLAFHEKLVDRSDSFNESNWINGWINTCCCPLYALVSVQYTTDIRGKRNICIALMSCAAE